jgi:hypothetical protein
MEEEWEKRRMGETETENMPFFFSDSPVLRFSVSFLDDWLLTTGYFPSTVQSPRE